jgi:alpha-glucosidase
MKGQLLPKTMILICALVFAAADAGAATSVTAGARGRVAVQSPDGAIEVTIQGNGPLTYSVSVDGKVLLTDSKLGLKFKDGVTLGARAQLTQVERDSSDTTWENPLGKRRVVRDRHNELRAFFQEESGRPFEIVVRVFDDGMGLRYVLPTMPSAATQDFVLEEELTQFAFPENDPCYTGENENTGRSEEHTSELQSL